MFTYNRESIDLNGTWRFCPDPMQRCRRQKWWKNPPKKNLSFPCWDVEGLWEIEVPGTWKTQFEELKWYEGHAVYLKEFSAKVPDGHEAFLAFDGIIYDAEIFLNGQFVTHHKLGYSPFTVRVTDLLMDDNQLFVLVENHLKADRVPGEIYDWNNDGGIINPVKLVFVPKIYIKNFKTESAIDGKEVKITVDIELEAVDRSVSEEVTVKIPELDLEEKTVVTAEGKSSVEFSIEKSAIELWCPENPRLYQTELSTQHETIGDEIGYREIKTEGRRMLLNGEPIRLYGMCVHSEFKDTGRTATPKGIKAMLDHAKDLGMNFLRCAHYPYADSFGRAMDKAGLMWWAETPAYWLSNMAEEGQTELACGIMRDMILRDWNRASVIIWSVSNECCYRNPEDFSENNYAYWFKAVPMVRELDSSRLISCAEAGNMIAVTPVWDPNKGDEFERNLDEKWSPGHSDEWYELFDVLAANIYLPNREDPKVAYRKYVEMLYDRNKPLMLSEFGSMSLRGADAPEDTLGSEAFHAKVIKDAYEAFQEIPEITGYCPWCLTDVRVPIHWRWYNKGKGVFRYGFLDENWEKKQVYSTLKESIVSLKKILG